jgi:hypothetical protein
MQVLSPNLVGPCEQLSTMNYIRKYKLRVIVTRCEMPHARRDLSAAIICEDLLVLGLMDTWELCQPACSEHQHYFDHGQ